MNNIWEKIKNSIKEDEERKLCVILFILIVICSVVLGIFYFIIYHYGLEHYFDCNLKAVFGIPCPGCGGTRALWLLLHGRIIESIYYHPIVIYVVGVLTVYMGSQFIRFLSNDRLPAVKYGHWFWIVGLVIFVVQYILKLAIPGYVV